MTAAAIRKRELEAMTLAEKYREENRALKERIAELEALMWRPRYVSVPSAPWDSIYIDSRMYFPEGPQRHT